MFNQSPTVTLPYFEVLVNGEYLRQYAKKVEIIEQTNAHPVVLLDIEYVGNVSAQGKTGVRGSWQYIKEQTPIAINFGMQPNHIRQIIGYVASYTLKNSADNKGQRGLITTCVQYTIVGASQVMQSTKNIAWKHTSPSTIAAAIATKNGFRSVIHPYVAAINYRLQNMSDFKFLCKLADEIGYRFYVDNTDLYFINPKVILNRSNLRNIPHFWSYNKPGLWDSIRSFEPIVGTITPDGGIVANRTISGINMNTGKTLSASDNYQLFNSPTSSATAATITKYFNDSPADSLYEANQKLVADTNANLYWLTANCVLRGDSRVKPNTLVLFSGSALPDTEAGYWLVQSVRHVLSQPADSGPKTDARYTIYAEVVRDQVYSATITTPEALSSATQIVPASLVGGTWRSSNIGAQIIAK